VADKRTLLLADDDVVLYADAAPEAIRGAMVQLYRVAQERSAAAGPERIDADGEVHPRRWRFTFGEDQEDLTVRQRGFLHAAVFPQIADQVAVDGVRYVAKVWKEYFRALFLGSRWESLRLPGQKRATPRKVRISTEDLTVKHYSEHIDKVIAHAVSEFGVVFNFDQQEREAVRWKPKKRAKPAAAAPAGEAVTA
jgi:hypothetical protein